MFRSGPEDGRYRETVKDSVYWTTMEGGEVDGENIGWRG